MPGDTSGTKHVPGVPMSREQARLSRTSNIIPPLASINLLSILKWRVSFSKPHEMKQPPFYRLQARSPQLHCFRDTQHSTTTYVVFSIHSTRVFYLGAIYEQLWILLVTASYCGDNGLRLRQTNYLLISTVTLLVHFSPNSYTQEK